ncbi:MAG: hypothetical protein AAB343_00480 [Patescibacteria group bacterium]
MANLPASQKILEIEEIRDNVLVIKNKGLRTILLCTSINFDLKSTDEQESIILSYQRFINTLDFPVQFFVSSRRLNIDGYLDDLRIRASEETNELLKIQTNEYIAFMKSLVTSNSIVTKTFYTVVPYQPAEATKEASMISGVFSMITGKQKTDADVAEKFDEWKSQLLQRVAVVEQGLSGIGIRSVALGTEELIELFRQLYNPDLAGPIGVTIK